MNRDRHLCGRVADHVVRCVQDVDHWLACEQVAGHVAANRLCLHTQAIGSTEAEGKTALVRGKCAGGVSQRVIAGNRSGEAQVAECCRASNQVLGLGAAQRALVGRNDDASSRVSASRNNVVVAVAKS